MKTEKKSIIIVTTTLYKSIKETRFKIACRTIQNAVKAGYPIVIVDGSPDEEIQTKFKDLGAIVFPELHRGMGPSRRQAFFHAWEIACKKDIGAILWIEAEKDDIIRSVPKIIEPITCAECAIVIPARTPESWKTWPEFQQVTEKEANKIYNNQNFWSDDKIDVMFGPIAFCKELAQHFICINPESIGLPDTYIQHFAPIFASRVNFNDAVRIEIDISYPPEQKDEEEGVLNNLMKTKRRNQLHTLKIAYERLAELC
ncbi:MAG: hypothetical protein COV70_02305 [Parcubacteria group bacterium CG11_big_fil_rev_8_21_14_0_20_39_22]|nr:MAG: hypothetical protein COV70_02305 [Parcubacteria group bacterium CG11_big_fil_rev_8_21_14_0_20_39_22]